MVVNIVSVCPRNRSRPLFFKVCHALEYQNTGPQSSTTSRANLENNLNIRTIPMLLLYDMHIVSAIHARLVEMGYFRQKGTNCLICYLWYNDGVIKKVKASSYIAQYPVLRTVQCALHFTSLTDLLTQTPSRLLWEASSHMLQLMREGCSYTYPPLSIVM